jgi:hypothetical protein
VIEMDADESLADALRVANQTEVFATMLRDWLLEVAKDQATLGPDAAARLATTIESVRSESARIVSVVKLGARASAVQRLM